MGDALGKLFVDVETIPNDFGGMVQILFLMGVYGVILFTSSNLISDGSELLLLIPSLAGVVGSIVLPVLGAVPDGAIVLFSGLGDNAQEQLSVGVGALAGSTIMLLTIPWFLSIVAGRVNIVDGSCKYTKPRLFPAGNRSLFGTGVEPTEAVARGGKVMLLTMLPYFLIQGPAFVYHCGKKADPDCHGAKEKYWALSGLVVCVLSFFGYLWDQMRQSQSQARRDRIDEVRKTAIHNSIVSLRGVFVAAGVEAAATDESHLLGPGRNKRLRSVLRSFFRRYDRDQNGFIDSSELRSLLADLNERPTNDEFDALMTEMDTDQSGHIDFEEFYEAMVKIVVHRDTLIGGGGGGGASAAAARGSSGTLFATPPPSSATTAHQRAAAVSGDNKVELNAINSGLGDAVDGEDDDEDEDEDEEVPEDLAHLTPEQQQTRIKIRSAWMMGLGTFLVLLFSDPTVAVLSEFGKRIHIPPFYISFVLAPLASNASELIAAYSYAGKKTKKTITISFAALEGACAMNNTFVVGIFLALIYFKSLIWEFSAETISIVFVELIMIYFSFKKIHNLFDAILIASIYPVSIGLVAGLEAAGLN